MKRVAIALFRNDLRLHDNPMLAAAAQFVNKSNSKGQGYLLPFYTFDARHIDLSALNDKASEQFEPATTREFKLPRCQNFRAK